MNQLQRADDIVELGSVRSDTAVSIYLPLTPAPDERDKNLIQLKNLVADARQQLTETHGMGAVAAQAFVQPVQRLLTDNDFWREQGTGVAIFLTGDNLRIYHLPLIFTTQAVVADRFHLKPLLPLLTQNGRFYLLTLNLGGTYLWEGTQYGISKIEWNGEAPASLEEALKWDDPEERLQWHTSTDNSQTRPAAFHGHGVTGDETKKEEIRRYWQQVDAGVNAILPDNEKVPLILVGLDYLQGIYRDNNSYGMLLETGLMVNPQSLSVRELHQQVWQEIVAPHFSQNKMVARASFSEIADTERAMTEISNVVTATHYGQVDILFLVRDVEQWGTFAADTGQVVLYEDPQEDAYDLLPGQAAVQTLEHGGTVYLMEPDEMPQQKTAVAILRYPVAV